MKPTTGQLGPRNPGPHGVTLRMIGATHAARNRRRLHEPRPARDRDRSLRGKARRLARRAVRS